jgi:2-haloacid dehalogenase
MLLPRARAPNRTLRYLPPSWCDDGFMITAADVDTLLFDVIGTVVDEGGTMRAEVAAELEAAGLAGPGRAGELAAAWEERSWSLTAELDRGGSWVSTDEVNARALADVLASGGGGADGGEPAAALPAEAVRRLGLVGHRLRPWPDAAAALAALARRFTVVALSNGNLSMLAAVSARGGLSWHAVLSAELVGARKPDPAVYRFALDRLALDPARTLMVAAHPWDLRAAAACGLRTAYIERAGEGRPEPSDSFGLSCPDLAALAAHLTGG